MSLILTDRIEDLPTEYLKCRVYGHSWDQIPEILGDPGYRRMFGWYDVLRCTSCRSERYDGVNALGDIGSRSYKYPEGYLLSFSLSKAEARREYLLRVRTTTKERELV